MLERLHKVLARAGVAALRPAEDLILQGRVTVNGRIVRELGARADPDTDVIAVDGELIQPPAPSEPHRYLMLHKPVGVISTAYDTHDRPTVVQLVPNDVRVFPVGRLDADSEGLILLTDDGDLAYRLTHPRFAVDKEYRVLVDRTPTLAELRHWRAGVELPEGGLTARAWVETLDREPEGTWLRVVMHEGRKRQIREIARVLGLNVLRLIRVREDALSLGDLLPGSWRELTHNEIEALRAHTQHVPSREADEERERRMADEEMDRPRRLRVVRRPRRDDARGDQDRQPDQTSMEPVDALAEEMEAASSPEEGLAGVGGGVIASGDDAEGNVFPSPRRPRGRFDSENVAPEEPRRAWEDRGQGSPPARGFGDRSSGRPPRGAEERRNAPDNRGGRPPSGSTRDQRSDAPPPQRGFGRGNPPRDAGRGQSQGFRGNDDRGARGNDRGPQSYGRGGAGRTGGPQRDDRGGYGQRAENRGGPPRNQDRSFDRGNGPPRRDQREGYGGDNRSGGAGRNERSGQSRYDPRSGGGGQSRYDPRSGGGGQSRYDPRSGSRGGSSRYDPRSGGGGGQSRYDPRSSGGGQSRYDPRSGGRSYDERRGGPGGRQRDDEPEVNGNVREEFGQREGDRRPYGGANRDRDFGGRPSGQGRDRPAGGSRGQGTGSRGFGRSANEGSGRPSRPESSRGGPNERRGFGGRPPGGGGGATGRGGFGQRPPGLRRGPTQSRAPSGRPPGRPKRRDDE